MTTTPTAASGSKTWSQLELCLPEPSMRAASPTSNPAMLPGSGIAISSQELEALPSPSSWQDGPLTDLFGQALAPASPSAPPESKAAQMTQDISGLSGFGSSASVALTQFLANRLRERLGSAGSIEFQQT